MIKNEKEYKKTLEQIKLHQSNIAKQKENFKALGLSDNEIETALEPSKAYCDQLNGEIQLYKELSQGTTTSIMYDFEDIGKALIALRISQGITQLELAKRLNVSASQVCRDETNEYHNATLSKIKSVLTALKVPLTITPSKNIQSA